MADIALNPFVNHPTHFRTVTTTDALCKKGSVVISAASTDSSAVVTSTTAGDNLVIGVITDEGDPNNSGLIPSGATVSCADAGDVEILVLGGTAYVVGDILICTTTAGVAGKYSSGSTYDQIGICMQKITTGSAVQRIACRLNIFKRAA